MRNQFDFKKLKNLCDNRRKRASSPWKIYHKKIEHIGEIIDISNRKIKDPVLLNEIYKQQVVALVTALEVYFREIFIFTIDEKRIKSDAALKSIRKDITLLEIMNLFEHYKRNKWKKSELLANEFNFQNLEGFKRAFKELLGIDILARLKKYKLEYGKNESFQLKKNFDVEINKILEVRHSIVHDISFRNRITYDKLIDYYNKMHEVVDVLESFLQDLVKEIN